MPNVGMTQDNNVMHTKPDLRVFLKWLIAHSGWVITDVMFLQVFSKNVFGNLAGLRDGAPRRSLRWLTSPQLYGLGLCGFERAAIELHRDVDQA